MNLILFGFKRCGKTHFGRIISKELGYTFVDTDFQIEELYLIREGDHLSCREIYRKEGSSYFRMLEKDVIERLTHTHNTIISVGGGAVLDPFHIKILKRIGSLVYLHTDKETLKKRIFGGEEIAAYLDECDPEEAFHKMHAERQPIYEAIPAIHINTVGKNEEEVVQLLKQVVEENGK
jgi:shikimate kinase